MSRKVLIIEDDPDIAGLVSLHLKDLDCEVMAVADGIDGLAQARAGHYNLIILDLMLPGLEGLELCRRLREEADLTPILMLTAKSSEADRVMGLEIGADVYLTKPFSIKELMARVKAIFRRAEVFGKGQQDKQTRLAVGEMVIDVRGRQVTVANRPVDLTTKEFELLLQFARNPGQVYSRQELLDLVWGAGYMGYEHTVNAHINRLRGKIETDPAKPEYVLTVWGVGYKFNDQVAA
jgi:DNA-binding response OmpR family regulator